MGQAGCMIGFADGGRDSEYQKRRGNLVGHCEVEERDRQHAEGELGLELCS